VHLILNKDSSNGWSFWYIKRNDKLISIDDLRYDYEQKFYKKQSNYCVEIPFETDAIHDIKIIFCMTMMNYNKFKQILNETIFEKSKADLLTKIANSPSRYIGLFRPTKPKAKLLQNLLQSHEIRFGDAFEIIIEEYLRIIGYEILLKH